MSERYSARDLCKELNYADWRNFDGLVQRAAEIIDGGLAKGSIKSTTTSVPIGSGALRSIPDYTIDLDAKRLITVLAAQYKPEETLVCARADSRLSWDAAFDGSDAHLLTAASQSAEPVALTEPGEYLPRVEADEQVWHPINTAPWSDDLIWVRKGDVIGGPKRIQHDDSDEWEFWAPCNPPGSRVPAATGAQGLTVSDALRQWADEVGAAGFTRPNAAERAAFRDGFALAQSAPAATAPSDGARQAEPVADSAGEADGWMQSGGLLYRLTDEHRPQNRDEINVTMANGSRKPEDCAARASQILALIAAPAPSASPDSDDINPVELIGAEFQKCHAKEAHPRDVDVLLDALNCTLAEHGFKVVDLEDDDEPSASPTALTDARIEGIWMTLDRSGSSMFEQRGWEKEMRRRFARALLAAQPPAAAEAEEVSRLRRIAWLIGSIYVHGNFVAETYNERELESLLRKQGTFWGTLAEFDAAMGKEGNGNG